MWLQSSGNAGAVWITGWIGGGAVQIAFAPAAVVSLVEHACLVVVLAGTVGATRATVGRLGGIEAVFARSVTTLVRVTVIVILTPAVEVASPAVDTDLIERLGRAIVAVGPTVA